MYHFIINPNARSGMGARIWHSLERILKERGISYQAHFTTKPRQATALASSLTADGKEHTLIVLGGDGSVNEVISGICHYDKVTFGYIPLGSGNDFARGLHIPKNPKKALELILSCQDPQSLDVGTLRYKEKTKHFAVSSGIGFDADICHEVVVSPLKAFLNRLKLGKLTYVCVAFHRLVVTSPCDYTITFDEGETVTYPKAYFVASMNQPYEGGGVKFGPDAKSDDGMLDLCIVSGINKCKALCLFPMAFLGIHDRFRGVEIRRCKSALIETAKPLPIHTDGEPAFLQNRIEVSCAKEQLHVITGKGK